MLQDLFEDVSPPVQGAIFTFTHSATAQRYETPPAWRGAYVTFISDTSALYLAFGDGGVKVGATEVAAVSGETLAPNWASGIVVPAGAAVSFPVSAICTHFSAVSSGGTGSWSAFRSSGSPTFGEPMPANDGVPNPSLWLDAGDFPSFTISAGVAAWRSKVGGFSFEETTNKPALLDAAAAGAGLIRAAVGFTPASSHKLVCTDAACAALFDGVDPFTLTIAVRRTAAAALHSLFSVSTNGSANGRWDFTLNAADDPVLTRVTAAGASSNSSVADTLSAGAYLFTWVFDGTAPTYYKNRVAAALTGTATGDVGTASKVTIGARCVNTSTFDQFAAAEISGIVAWNRALSADQLSNVHAWLKRRYGI